MSEVERPPVEELFARALELPADQRDDFIARECGGDAALHARLRDLLRAHDAVETEDSRGAEFLRTLDAARAAALLDAADGVEDGAPIGRYEILRRVGRGGMGLVYLARDPALDRPVALKLLPPYLTPDVSANRRLVHEARAASALDHPHIATVYEIGEADDGRLFIAMAYYEGGTLRERLRGGPLPVADAAAVASQVADGLAAAHARGIVHRDIKPENLALGARNEIKILDFGVAKVSTAALTGTGAVRGTVSYMSPEQTRGGPVDERADVWSLGVVLYEMLAGRRPFQADASEAVVFAIRNDAPEPLRTLRPEVPPRLAAVVERCLEKDPASRYGSAAEVAAALRDASADEPRSAAAGGEPVWRRVAAYVALGLLGYAAAGHLIDRFLLPAWAEPAVLLLLLGGLAAVLSTVTPAGRLLSWPRTLAAGASGIAVLSAGAGYIVANGTPRVTDARGTAGAAFEAHGWVVVADFDASPEALGVARAAREALLVDLQQSGFVNVVGRGQLAGILQRMGLPDTARLALPIALEAAERAGAGAVLSASVSRLGPQYVLSGRATRPGSGEELFAVRTAAGQDQLLGAVERLSREMRRRLGEEREAIRRSRALPLVTTRSLDALKLYAEAERMLTTDPSAAAALAREAIRADSTFAMAHRLAGAAATSQLRFGDARHHLTHAYELRDRLTERERWHVEAIYRAMELEPHAAAATYERLLRRYPDDWRATFNLAGLLQSWLDDHTASYAAFRRAAELEPQSAPSLNGAATAAFFAGRPREADSIAAAAAAHGLEDLAVRWRMISGFARGDAVGAAAACDSLLAASSRRPGFAEDQEVCGSMDVASGRLRLGIARLEAAERRNLEAGRYRNAAHAGQSIALALLQRDGPEAAAARIERVLEVIPAGVIPEPDRFITRTNLQVQAALLGRPDLMDRIGATYPPYPDPQHWFGALGESLVAAARAVERGDGAEALRVLRAGWPSDRDAIGWRIWNELLQGMAFDQLEQFDSAAVLYARAADPRYHTLPSLTKNRIYLPVALHRLAAAHERRGDAEGAALAYRRLRALRSGADPELRPERDSIAAALARLGAGE